MILQIFLFGYIILSLYFDKISLSDIGFTKKNLLRALAALLIIESISGISYFLISFITSFESIVIIKLTNKDYIIGFLYNWLIVAPLEETVFRGIVYNKCVNFFGKNKWFFAALVSSLLFGLVHVFSRNSVLYAFIVGIILCIIYKYTSNIYFNMFLHAMINGYIVIGLDKLASQYAIYMYFFSIIWIAVIILITFILFRLNELESTRNHGLTKIN